MDGLTDFAQRALTGLKVQVKRMSTEQLTDFGKMLSASKRAVDTVLIDGPGRTEDEEAELHSRALYATRAIEIVAYERAMRMLHH